MLADIAEKARIDAEIQRQLADDRKVAAEKSAAIALAAEKEAVVQRNAAVESKLAADIAREAAQAALLEANRQRYNSMIGLASAKISENAYGGARDLLSEIQTQMSDLRNWEWGRLAYLANQSSLQFAANDNLDSVAWLPILNGEGEPVQSVEPQHFVAAGETNARLWNINNKEKAIATLGQEAHVTAVSSRGGLIAVGGAAGKGVQLWKYSYTQNEAGEFKLATPTEFADATLMSEFGDVTALAFSADGSHLFAASSKGNIEIFNVSNDLSPTFSGRGQTVHEDVISTIAVSPNGSRFVTASLDQAVKIHNMAGKTTGTFLAHTGPVYAAAFSTDGNLVASGGEDKRILLWDPNDVREYNFAAAIQDQLAGREVVVAQQQAVFDEITGDSLDDRHIAAIRSLRFSGNGLRLISSSNDNTVKVWKTQDNADIWRLEKTLRGHGGKVPSCDLSFDGTRIVSVAHDSSEQARVWEIQTYTDLAVLGAEVVSKHEGPVLAAAFAPVQSNTLPAPGDVAAQTEEEEQFRVLTTGVDRTARTWLFKYVRSALNNGAWEYENVDSHIYREGHIFGARQVAVNSDQSRIVSAATDNTARIWDAVAGAELDWVRGAGSTGVVAISPAGDYLVTGSDGFLYEEYFTPEEWSQLKGGDDLKSPLATGSKGDALKLWTGKGEFIAEVQGLEGPLTAVTFAPKGGLFVAGDHSGNCSLWDAPALAKLAAASSPDDFKRTARPLRWLANHNRRVNAMTFMDERRIATAGADGQLIIHEVSSGRELNSMQDAAKIMSIAYHPTSDRLLTGSQDGVLVLWDPSQGSIWSIDVTQEKFGLGSPGVMKDLSKAYAPSIRAVAFRSDSEAIFALGAGSTVRKRDAEGRNVVRFDGKTVYSIPLSGSVEKLEAFLTASRPFSALVISGDENQQVVGAGENEVVLWNLKDGKQEKRLLRPHHHVLSANFDSKGERFVTAGADGSARVWSVADRRATFVMSGHDKQVNFAEFSPDDKFILTASADGKVRQWTVPAEGEAPNLTPVLFVDPAAPKGLSIQSAVYSVQDGVQYVLAACSDGNARIWKMTEPTAPLLVLKHSDSALHYAEFAPVREAARTAKLAKIAAIEKQIAELTAETPDPESAVAVRVHTERLAAKKDELVAANKALASLTLARLVTTCEDTTAVIWEGKLEKGAKFEKKLLQAHTAAVTSAAFSPDGTRLLTGSNDFTAKLWNVDQGTELMTLQGHEQEVTDVAFSNDAQGRYALTASRDGTAIVWLAEPWNKTEAKDEIAAK